VRTNTLRVTFRHEAGEVTEAMRVDFQALNQPPVVTATVIEGNDFLGQGPVFFTRRAQSKAAVSFAMQVTDPDSTGIVVQWRESGSDEVVETNFQWSGEFSPGTHTLGGTALDEESKVTATPVRFEVLTARQGVQRLRATVRERVAAGRRRLMGEPLFFAEQAIKQRQWKLADSYLRAFQRRVGRQVGDEDLRELLNGAAQMLIDEALAR
jgi:hypothetical protein